MHTSPWFDQVPDQKRFPTLAGVIKTDVVVIGAGIAGVMAAYHLAQAGRSVVILEKNHIATGDTGLTTGFLTRVPDASIAGLLKKYNATFVQQLFQATSDIQQELFQIIAAGKFDCMFQQCSSFWGAYDHDNANVQKEWAALQQCTIPAQWVSQTTANATQPFTEAIEFNNEGRIHIRLFITALLKQLQAQSARVFEETEVLDFKVADTVTVFTSAGQVQAQQIILATGAPLPVCAELEPLLTPYVTHVIAAKFNQALPLNHDLRWDVLNPYFYYRTISDDTLIVGGCDHPVGEQLTPSATNRLNTFIQEHFSADFTITHEWAGSILHTSDGLPYAFAHPHYKNKVFAAMGFGGNGLIGGSWAGKTVAEMILEKTKPEHALLALKRTGVTIAAPTPRALASDTPSAKTFIKVATVDQLKPNSKMCVSAQGRKLVLFHIGEKYYAMDNNCSHAGGSLGDGTLVGTTVECPLHGAKFDVTSGAVVGPPAVRAQRIYSVRVVGTDIEVELPTGAATNTAATPPLPHRTYWKQLALFSLCPIAVWCLEFLYQYYLVIPQQMDLALVRASALTGATFFAVALSLSALFKWRPKLAAYWRLRRYCGVSGFISITLHVLLVTGLMYQWQVSLLYYTLHPIQNPIIFGSLAFPFFLVMAATSTDWAVEKLGAKRWKNIHRIVYFGYALAITHFLIINPIAWQNVAGYILLGLTACALVGQLYWFLRISAQHTFRSLGTRIGIAAIIWHVFLGYIIWQQLAAYYGNS